MFISVHANSLDNNIDISKVQGLSVFYNGRQSQKAAQTVFDHVRAEMNRGDKGLHSRNHYVTRSTWAPAMIIETGFMPNPYEFEWLINNDAQKKIAQSIADAVVKYYKGV
jgi:N-acetylmuramoyl-L-alanine amidase